jgi:hypothetical protein
MNSESLVRIQLSDGPSRREVSTEHFRMSEFVAKATTIAKQFQSMLAAVRPQEGTIEFGLEATFEAGQLTALIAKGGSTANIKVTLTWKEERADS